MTVSPLVETLARSDGVRRVFLVGVFVAVAVACGAFVLDTSDAAPDPVPFEQTTDTGLAAEDMRELEEQNVAVPQVEVFNSQYEYVVGYRGVASAVTTMQESGHTRQFGYPIAVYVSDFTGTGVDVSGDGYLQAEADPAWVDATEAWFVVGSEARTTTDEVAVPFGERPAAAAFAEEHGGDVLDWSEVQTHPFDVDGAAVVREQVDDKHARADRWVADARQLLDRDGEVLEVGRDARTIQAALDAAPANATVRIPSGTYDETVVVERPVTIRGDNATIDGGGSGTVIEVRSDDVAVTGVTITGVGNETRAPEGATRGSSGETGSEWGQGIEQAYGHADAGLLAVETDRLYVDDVRVETPASGIALRDVGRAVVEETTVEGSDEWLDGFMGLVSIRSPVVVQNSTFVDGRDGIYTHRAHGSVVRNSRFEGNRFGVHYMYTSELLNANNVYRGQTSGGITIMTASTHNAVVGNDIRNAGSALTPSGSRSYIAGNVVANSTLGISTAASNSVYERNVVYGNEIGFRASSLRPTNRVVNNDIVANDEPVTASTGPLYLWSHQGVGNYWGGAQVRPGQGGYVPTDPIDGSQHRIGGTATLAASPAARLLDSLRDTTPGIRDATVMDTAPLSDPVRPDVLAALRGAGDG